MKVLTFRLFVRSLARGRPDADEVTGLVEDCIRMQLCTAEAYQAWTGKPAPETDGREERRGSAVTLMKLRLPLAPALANFVETSASKDLSVADMQVVAQIEAAHRIVLPLSADGTASHAVATPRHEIELNEWIVRDAVGAGTGLLPDFLASAALLFREVYKVVEEHAGVRRRRVPLSAYACDLRVLSAD